MKEVAHFSVLTQNDFIFQNYLQYLYDKSTFYCKHYHIKYMFIYIGCQNDIKLLQKKSKEKNNFRDKENHLAINYNK